MAEEEPEEAQRKPSEAAGGAPNFLALSSHPDSGLPPSDHPHPREEDSRPSEVAILETAAGVPQKRRATPVPSSTVYSLDITREKSWSSSKGYRNPFVSSKKSPVVFPGSSASSAATSSGSFSGGGGASATSSSSSASVGGVKGVRGRGGERSREELPAEGGSSGGPEGVQSTVGGGGGGSGLRSIMPLGRSKDKDKDKGDGFDCEWIY